MKNKKTYYQKLDIIRVLSCIAVFLYHLNILKGGFLAVCVFFTLSGYLSCISSLQKEKFSIKEYYISRIKKIYIPLFIIVMITIATLTLFPDINWLNLKPETTSVLLGYNNFWQLNANLDYFTRHISSPFMHMWYIAILLQFELFFPIAFLILKNIGEKLGKFTKHIANLDVDLFANENGIYILEMNARFGGGYPFSHMAGVNLPEAIIKWCNNENVDRKVLEVKQKVLAHKDISIVKLNVKK